MYTTLKEMNLSAVVSQNSWDKNTNVFRFLIEVGQIGGRTLKKYQYIKAKSLDSEMNCQEVALATAIEEFLGRVKAIPVEAKLELVGSEKKSAEIVESPIEEQAAAQKETKKEVKKEAAAQKKAAKEIKKNLPKTVAYDREKAAHKRAMVGILNKKFPKWSVNDAIRGNILKMSESFTIDKKPIFNEAGEILPSFSEAIVSFLKDTTVSEANQ